MMHARSIELKHKREDHFALSSSQFRHNILQQSYTRSTVNEKQQLLHQETKHLSSKGIKSLLATTLSFRHVRQITDPKVAQEEVSFYQINS